MNMENQRNNLPQNNNSKNEEHRGDVESLSVDEIVYRLEIGTLKKLDSNVAIRLINAGQTEIVLDGIKTSTHIHNDNFYFSNLNSEVVNKLIDLGNIDCIIRAIHNDSVFDKLNSTVVNKLIDAGKLDDVTYFFGFPGAEKLFELDKSLADKLIEKREFYSVLNYLDFFPIQHDVFVNTMIEAGEGEGLANRMTKTGDRSIMVEQEETFLKHLNEDTVEFLKNYIKNKESSDVYKLRDKFSLKEIMSKYDYFRVKSWEENDSLKKEDKDIFDRLKENIDEETLGRLWKNSNKEELHIIGPQILRMYGLTKLELGYNSDTFRGEYLEKIINDNAQYTGPIDDENWVGDESITALRKFNNIVEGLSDTSRVAILKDASSFEQTKALAEKLTKENPYRNWENLKKFYELAELLKKREVLEKLQNLKNEGKEKHYKFFSDLAFHPGSKISMQTVFQFMENPERFLDVEDDHSGEAHERKKPSNYTRFDYLDINAEDLRDALIEGTLDKLQYFKPFEAGYKIADKNYSKQDIIELLKNALGSFREKIQGNAKNPGKLFKETQEILKSHNVEYKDLVENPSILTNELRTDLENILFSNNFGIKDERKFEEYRVKIHPKSSPEGHLAGNDTACCMPFGSGKNNVYMYNLGCSILTVQRKAGNSYRTIAQSVLTPDVDINHSISDLVGQVKNETLLSNVITEDLTQKKKIIITADNIEVAPNAEKFKNSIEVIYADFVSRYAQEIDSNEIDKNRMLIGKGYSDLDFSRSKSIDNTFIPITPVAYSDNYGEEVYELPLTEKSEIIPLPNYGFLQKSEKQSIDPNLPRGVSYLTAHDTLRVSYMEGKVYAENESLVQYIHRIGNELTAKDINNNFKDRPNLSLKIEDEKGGMLGYMIAYEGSEKSYDHGDIDDETQVSLGQKLIYISDLAVDVSKSKLAGGKLIKAFESLVKREYLDKDNPLPIVAQARESTSYKLLQNHLNDLGKEYGYEYELEENGSYESGSDTMYQIKLIPKKI